MIHVLFVCLGNICRSPMAEAIFRHIVKREGLQDSITTDSAGTGDWHIGHPPHEGTRRMLEKKVISYEGIKARQIHSHDFENFHYIFAMDEKNVTDLKDQIQNVSGPNVYFGRLLDFVEHDEIQDVPDPYFTGNFEEVYDLINNACEEILIKIKKDHHL